MRALGDRPEAHRLCALIVLLWRAGLRISEALALQESDLDASRGAVLVRRGKGGKRREVGMDRWAWDQLDAWLEIRRELPIGALLRVIHGPTAGRRWEASAARKQLHHAAAAAGVRRRFAPHQLGHAHAVEMAHEGVPSSDDPGRLDRSAYHLIHPIIIAGIVVTAAGDQRVLADPGEVPTASTAAMILGGSALYLAGHAAFKVAVWRALPTTRIAAVSVLGLLGLLARHVSVLALAACAATVLVALAAADRVLIAH